MAVKVTVLVGTTKGAFFFHSDTNRHNWKLTGPHLDGWEIYSLTSPFGVNQPNGNDNNSHDQYKNRIYAGTSHFVYGPTIRFSDDLGASWTQVADGPHYSQESGLALSRIWQIVPGHPSEPNTLFAGVEPAGLFVSRDAGITWREITSLSQHPTRAEWAPGNGGLCLHTILIDPHNPQRMWIGISAVGVFRTTDGGQSWQTCNQGLPQGITGIPNEEVGRCVHKLVLDPVDSNILYCQFHGGVFKSTNAGDYWQPIEEGLPSNFGFPMVVASNGNLFVIPLESDMLRHVNDGLLKVYCSNNAGQSWSDSSHGLPEPGHFVSVLRDAMDTDNLEPSGIYFGTSMGEVFCSSDCGENWLRLPGQLPRITSVRTWIREEA
jgi:photosystem II stability/assembly factor-like uncharacterized protein